MEHARLSSLLVIALLQLSQTEISSTLPESWYAANVISDGAYSPKPISEIFSTQPTFSTTNPIIVLQSSTPDSSLFTTPRPSFATSTVGTTFSTTARPTEISVVPLPTEQPAQSYSQVLVSSETPPVTYVLDTLTSREPQPQRLPELSQFQQPPAPPSPPPVLSTPQQIQIQTAPQGTAPQGTSQGTLPPQIAQNLPPNYILVYQQSPQFQGLPQGQAQLLFPPVTSTTSLPTISSTSSPRPTSTPLPRSSSTTQPRTSVSPQAPCTNNTNTRPGMPSYLIRLVAPRGSVTNVKINPPTTTRRPTTTRTKRNRNNYDGCVSGCGGRKTPICASPLGTLGASSIDPDTLKGFPSVCHMACHNSFRKNLYEKVMDGRCGRLRTRIKLVGSKNKLKKDDLNKASYTVVQDGPSVIEFSPLNS